MTDTTTSLHTCADCGSVEPGVRLMIRNRWRCQGCHARFMANPEARVRPSELLAWARMANSKSAMFVWDTPEDLASWIKALARAILVDAGEDNQGVPG